MLNVCARLYVMKYRLVYILLGLSLLVYVALRVVGVTFELHFPLLGFYTDGVDISNNAELWGGYSSNTTYTLHKDVFLLHVDDGFAGERLTLVPERSFPRMTRYHTAPDHIRDYENGLVPAKKYSDDGVILLYDIRGVVQKGVTLKTQKLEKYFGCSSFFGCSSNIVVWATILDGDHAGETVELDSVSQHSLLEREDVFVYRPDVRLLSAD